MQCNIDEKGARLRRTWGIMNVVVAVLLAGLAWWSGIWWLWIAAGVCAAAGTFAIYEARKKWCVMRAMGMKTSV
jgi:hypothetical protein